MANWFIRKTGSDTNGGSSSSASPDRSGTDGVATGTTTLTSVSAAFTAGDVGKGINVAGVVFRIVTYTNASTVLVDRNITTGTSLVWNIGGALLTINKVTNIGVTTVFQAGDSVWIGAGVYREVITLGQSYSTSKILYIGDVDGVMTGDAGEVLVTAYTTNDKTAPSSTPVLNINATRNFFGFRNINFVGGSSNPSIMALSDSKNWEFVNCAFLTAMSNNVSTITCTSSTASAINGVFDRCRFHTQSSTVFGVSLPTSAVADYDANIVIKNCIIDVLSLIADISGSGALTFKGGGVYFYNNTMRSSGSPNLRTSNANVSTTFPVRVENCILISSAGVTPMSANAAGQIIEAYNLYSSNTARTNITTGTGVISNGSYAALLWWGQENVFGGLPKPEYSPHPNSGLIGFGASGNAISTDIFGVTRPAGGSSASFTVGAYERPNTWVKETGTVRTGTNALSITGPGYQDFQVPVDASSTTITVYIRWDATYAGTKPSMSVLYGTESGVSNATATAAGSSGSWEQLTLNFTPTAKGIVTIRLLSSDTNGAGRAYADDFAIA